MAKREPRAFAPCPHDIAQWRTSGPLEHRLRCCRCQDVLERAFGEVPAQLGKVLFRNIRDGSYAPFNPRWQ